MKYLKEVESNKDIEKNRTFGMEKTFEKIQNARGNLAGYKRMYANKHYYLLGANEGRAMHYVAVDHMHRPIMGVRVEHYPGDQKFGKIDTLAKNPSYPGKAAIGAHHLYHDLMHHGVVNGLVTDEQSEGGMKVWQKLNKMRSVNIHGWNEDEGKPVNLGKRFDPDETHVDPDESGNNYQHFQNDRWKTSKKLNSTTDTLKKKKLANTVMSLDADRQDFRDQRDMQLVAHLKKKKMNEDAPTNSASAGAIAGLYGDAVGGRPLGKRGKFGRHETFIVSPHTFLNARNQKRKGAHWRKYLEEDETYNDIREYAFKKPKSPIILQCERTGAMCFARFGRDS